MSDFDFKSVEQINFEKKLEGDFTGTQIISDWIRFSTTESKFGQESPRIFSKLNFFSNGNFAFIPNIRGHIIIGGTYLINEGYITFNWRSYLFEKYSFTIHRELLSLCAISAWSKNGIGGKKTELNLDGKWEHRFF